MIMALPRTDLTTQECASVLGGLIGSLALTNGSDVIRGIVQYAADTDGLWDVMLADGMLDKAIMAWSSRATLLNPPHSVSRAHLASLVGLAGSLVPMASGVHRDRAVGVRVVRSAFRWWSDTDAAWAPLQKARDIAQIFDSSKPGELP